MTLLLAGFLLSFVGSLPPGLISLAVAQTSIQRGVQAAFWLAVGAAGAEFFQAWLASAGADWFLQHPFAKQAFEWCAIPVFWGAAVYLFFWAKPPRDPGEYEAGPPLRQILKGIVISVFNLLAIPYWFAYCGWLRLNGWWREGLAATWIFSFGVVIGTLLAMLIYIWLGQAIVQRSELATRITNRVVALIFFGLGLKLVVQVLFPSW